MSFISRNHPQQVRTRGAVDEVDDRRTPDDLFAECLELAGEDGFDLDPAANRESARAPSWYTLADDGLIQPWFGRVWLNPPYSSIPEWVAKAHDEMLSGRVDVVVMLLPANRTEQTWWQDYIEPHLRSADSNRYVRFLRGRRRFDRPGWSKPAKGDRPPFGLCLVVWK